ncbi:hypothetical protein CEF21_06870 [Bacillus sp. FJAT-42376]|uniref:hypothetical protein n=1 Tax=Bacillus sp. FJAT-42376 TaxID=2014076 RepID=UPI000F507FD0|nr:hypothetical protein [Bacillus sp. FJAT-42376]AZB42036.1 hypothetical protein CEF21_06870 [Bacillus sp. FJAT-42376]
MKQILRNTVLGVFTQNNHLYFCENQKFFVHDFSVQKQISEDEYWTACYGTAYPKILQQFGVGKALDASWAKLDDGSVLIHYYQDDDIYRFNKNGEIMMKTDLGFDTIYSLAIQGGSFWCAYPTNHTIKRYSLETFAEEASIGDQEPWSFKAEIFDHPEHVFVKGNHLFVSDMGNRRVCRVDLSSFEVEDYLKADEPVWGYMAGDDQEVVHLESGYYLYSSQV